MSTALQALGVQGERVAAKVLMQRGWEILDHRFRAGHRDIDLVAARETADGRTVIFVEVKTRRRAIFGGPVEAVGWRKQRELSRSAAVWLESHHKPGDTFRFDVIEVILEKGKPPKFRHIENAFGVSRRAR